MVFRRISSLKELPEMKLTVNTGRKPMTYEESIEAADLSSFDTSENSENMGSPKHKMEQRLSEIEITADEDEEDCESEIEERALILLGWDLSTWKPLTQYIILCTGMMISMCFHGYLQEYIIYGWFDRKFSLFTSFLHFVGFSIFTFFQRKIRTHLGSEVLHRKLPWWCHLCICIIRTLTQALTNLSMSQINYPAKVLFKSAMPVITMFLGVTFFQKVYKIYDYFAVFLLVLGLYIFLMSGDQSTPQWTPYGLILVTCSLFGSSIIPILQEFWIWKYNCCHDEILCYSFYGSTIISFIITLSCGEFFTGLTYIYTTGNLSHWIYYIMFLTFGFLGAHCSAALTTCCGALIAGVTFTARKAITLVLSFALFPNRNILTYEHIYGAIIFLAGLIIRSFLKNDNVNKFSGKLKANDVS